MRGGSHNQDQRLKSLVKSVKVCTCLFATGTAKRPKRLVRAQPRVFMSPARAGSFNANFSPETLESFKSLCRDQSRQYTKVLERLAELYLGSQGGILENPEDASLDTGSQLHSNQIAGLSQEAVKQLETVASMLERTTAN